MTEYEKKHLTKLQKFKSPRFSTVRNRLATIYTAFLVCWVFLFYEYVIAQSDNFWIGLLFGTIMGLLVDLASTNHQSAKVWATLKEYVDWEKVDKELGINE